MNMCDLCRKIVDVKTGFLDAREQWISIIALFAVESWWKNGIVQNSIVYLLSLIVMAHKKIQKY